MLESIVCLLIEAQSLLPAIVLPASPPQSEPPIMTDASPCEHTPVHVDFVTMLTC
jgi:hypothetical protein